MLREGFEALIFPNSPDRWHEGDQTVTFGFQEGVLPDYYVREDRDKDGVKDEVFLGFDVIYEEGQDIAPNDAARALAIEAMKMANEVANVNLSPAPEGALGDVLWGVTGFGDPEFFGFADLPDIEGVGTFRFGGDIFLNSDKRAQTVNELGHTSWATFIHELGHALGLEHPNDDADNDLGLPDNSVQYTQMSYVPHPSVEDFRKADQAWPLTYQMYDIQALQFLYGVNTVTRSGQTTYLGDGTGEGSLAFQYGDANMKVNGRDVILTIWDAGGHDLIDASDVQSASTISLRPGTFSTIGAIEDNVGLSAAVRINGEVINLIEDATGGVFDDRITGNGGDNRLVGGAGEDVLNGAKGTDRLVGGRDADTLRGGQDDDSLRGGGQDDRLRGGDGQDWLKGGAGDDTLTGGAGPDLFVYVSDQKGGADVVTDFEDGMDLIQIEGELAFEDIEINQQDDGVELIWADNRVLLRGASEDLLNADDFEFLG